MKLSLSMIAKDEIENLKRLYPLIKEYVDEWVVVVPPNDDAIVFLNSVGAKVIAKDFTQAIESTYIKDFEKYDLDVPREYRLFNFAAARNESLSNCTGDYILWLDADDEPLGLENVRGYIAGREHVDVFDAVYDYAKDREGNSISDHVRERIIRNNGKFEWKGAELGLIHETLIAKNFRPTRLEFPRSLLTIEHIPESGHDISSSTRNHIALLYEYLKTNGKDPRTTYYLGTSFFNMKQYDFCIKVLLDYVKTSGWDEERYRAWIRIAEAYHQLNDKDSSRNAYLNAIKELPNYPDAYLGLGESYYSGSMYEKAVEFIMTGLGKPIPKTKSTIDMVKYTFRPLPFLALSNMEMGRLEEAYKWFKNAKKINPNHEWIRQYSKLFEEMHDLDEYVKSFVKLGQISQKLYPETLSKLAEVIPDSIKDQELLLSFKRRYATPKTWADNSIVIFASSAFEDWGPDSLRTGCGGSEEAVIHLTKRWAAMGWDVTVYNNCPKEETRNGVHWVRFERFNPRDDFNILISWRNNPFLEPKNAKKRFVDIHDVPNNQYYTPESLKNVTVMVKSQYHRSLMPHLEDSNFSIVPNGVETARFDGGNRIKNRLVWTSSYDRGLEYLLEMWPEIKNQVPDATLDVAYGFNLFDESTRGKTDEGREWKRKMLRLLAQDGVSHRGRVSSAEATEMYNSADVWAYPTDFPEIDCITATKAMAAGCVPITTDFAVMKERNQGIIVKGDIKSAKIWNRFKAELISLLKDERRKQDIRSKIKVASFDWDRVAHEWDKKFREEDRLDCPLVSIIIPTYNRPDFLQESIHSAMQQTYPNKEIIVIDDGSDVDVSVPSGVRYIRIDHSGKPSKVRNEGIKASRGEWHFFLDDDDKFASRHSLDQLMRHSAEGSLIYSDTVVSFPSKEITMYHSFTNLDNLRANNTLPGVYLLRGDLSKSVLFNEDFEVAEDYERSIRLIEAGATPVKVDHPHYWYRHHGDQIQYNKTVQQDNTVEKIHNG